jgi:uncharacterized protein YggU (UPF0235/DUF167 family)
MRVSVMVHPGSRMERVDEQADGSLVVWVKARAEKRKANVAVVKLLSRHFGGRARIVSGITSRQKIIEVH